MRKPEKRVRVETRPTKDLERFASALLDWALCRLKSDQTTEASAAAPAEPCSIEKRAS